MKIRIRSVTDKFRRAGLAFVKTPAEYEVDEKTLEILKAEPMLVVETQNLASLRPEPAKAEDKKGGGKG